MVGTPVPVSVQWPALGTGECPVPAHWPALQCPVPASAAAAPGTAVPSVRSAARPAAPFSSASGIVCILALKASRTTRRKHRPCTGDDCRERSARMRHAAVLMGLPPLHFLLASQFPDPLTEDGLCACRGSALAGAPRPLAVTAAARRAGCGATATI